LLLGIDILLTGPRKKAHPEIPTFAAPRAMLLSNFTSSL
jgi:hypothetical protein